MATKTKTTKVSSLKKKAEAKKATDIISEEKNVKKSEEKLAKKKAATKGVESDGLAQMDKQDLIQLFATKTGDTGSPEIQVALATHKILNLQQHLEQNPKDNHSRRGLLKVISKRRRILNYLEQIDAARYKTIIAKLYLKK